MDTDRQLEELAQVLRQSRRVVALTGAGMSAESGIPTFRDALEGHWADDDPLALAAPEGFARDPERVTRWYDQRRAQCAACQPHEGHRALAAIERGVETDGGAFMLVTQNVDALHGRAGSRGVVELHGSLARWRCIGCGEEREERGPAFGAYPPRCEVCGGIRRPGVVWFGELLPTESLAIAQEASSECALFLSIGTSAVVEPAAGLLHLARRGGALTCEINPEPTPASPLVDWAIAAPAGQALPALAAKAFAGT